MKRVTRNGVIAVAAASGAMAMAVPVSAFAADGGATADGAAIGSPGVISGNTIQLPVHLPVNVCGNTVNVVGLLNPAAGNKCANGSDSASGSGSASAGRDRATSTGGATARESGKDSPGVLSGNGVQLPVHLPVNVSGNSVNVVGIGNPATGNTSTNTSVDHPGVPAPQPVTPPERSRPEPVSHTAPAPRSEAPSLAHTGADGTVPALAASAALVLGGAALYRRHRPGASR
ncbi:chaplin [Streptomyces anandii]|uniref:chaplin n=1 Tax=Streptomyces anandii TaxID=285454 RepID=UPI003700464E